MTLLARARSFWRNLTGRAHVERALDDELESYVGLLAAEKERAGMSPSEARRAAVLELGGVDQVKEQVRDARAGALLESTLRDVRYAMRSLGRTPAFTGAAVAALALGIGATSAIYSVVDAVLLKPLPYAQPDRLVTLLHGAERIPVSPANYLTWKRELRSFDGMGAAQYWSANVIGGDQPERVQALRVSAGLLDIVGVPPILGRLFVPEEGEPGRSRSVILSYGFWQSHLGGARDVVGRELRLDGEPYTVVGVMPRDFDFPMFWARGVQLWAPLAFGPAAATNRGDQTDRILARLAPGTTLEQARAEVAALTARLDREFPGSNRDVRVTPLAEIVTGDVRTPLLVLLVAVGFLLLIACANVAHMLLARGAARQRELSVRAALGASRGRIVRQLLAESVVLALAGGTVGLLLAWRGVGALLALAGRTFPRAAEVGLDARVLAATVLISLVTGIAFGLLPALRASSGGPSRGSGGSIADNLRDGGRGASDGGRRSRLRSTLVASEVALALVLLVGAGLSIRSFQALRRVDPVLDPRGVVTMVVSLVGSPEFEPGARAAFYDQMLERVRALPGVASAGAINHLPLAGDLWGRSFWVEGKPRPAPGERQGAAYRVVYPGYFETMRIPLVRGRGIAESDRMDAPPVAVVNEFFASRHWPGEDAVGKRITITDPDDNPTWITVVGVVRNVVQHSWEAERREEMYLAFPQTPQFIEARSPFVGYITLVARAACASPDDCDAAALAPALRRAVWSIDRNLPIADVQTMENVIDAATGRERFTLVLLAVFASVALLLATLGIYGVTSYTVSRRTHELGVRMALGARPTDVVRLVVGQGMVVVLAGAIAGLLGAFALTRLMAKLLFGVGAADLLTYAGVAALLVAVAFVASWVPARRAARIDPLRAIRAE